MSAEVFLDTNILVYAFHQGEPTKAARAQNILKKCNWAIGWQVIQEFSNVALHRFAAPIRPEDLADYIELVLWPRCLVLPNTALYRHALALSASTQYQFYDCLIVAAALASGAPVLYSEDLQHGRAFGSLRIENPFCS